MINKIDHVECAGAKRQNNLEQYCVHYLNVPEKVAAIKNPAIPGKFSKIFNARYGNIWSGFEISPDFSGSQPSK